MTTQEIANATIATINAKIAQLNEVEYSSQMLIADAMVSRNASEHERLIAERQTRKGAVNQLQSKLNWIQSTIIDVIARGYEPRQFDINYLNGIN